MDYVHARRLEQRDEIGQRALVADAELVAPEARQAHRVGVHGVGQSGKGRRALREGLLRRAGRACGGGRARRRARSGLRQRLDLEGVADDLGEQRRFRGGRQHRQADRGGQAAGRDAVGRGRRGLRRLVTQGRPPPGRPRVLFPTDLKQLGRHIR